MEQMEAILTVPSISKTSVSSTPKLAASEDDKSFADLYEQNISDSKTSSSDTTKTSAKKEDQSVSKSDNSDNKADASKIEDSEVTKNTDEKLDQSMAAIQWQNMIILATDTKSEDSLEATIDTSSLNTSQDVPVIMKSDVVHVVAASVKEESNDAVNVELSKTNISFSDIQTESTDGVDEMVQVPAATISSSSEIVMDTAAVTKNVEEISEVDIPVSTVTTESNTVNNISMQSTTVNAKQTVESTVVNSNFAAEMVDDLPQNNIQQNIMNQIEGSLGKIVKTGNNEIRIQLEPEQLGVLNIRIIAGKDGTQVVFKADSHQSSQLIAAQTDSLKTMLNEAGIKVDQIVVNDFSFSQENFQNQQTFEQQSGKNSKLYKGFNGSLEQSNPLDTAYELPQTIVGLNYLI
jgi:flagellar hook-length control protein FliK